MQPRNINAGSAGASGQGPVDGPAEIGGYRLVELLGRGGMGEVWRAEREGPGGIRRRAAVKRILPRLRNDPVLRERFLAEARTNARLEHPNIVQVLDFGDQPEPYLILEYVEGVVVADLLSELAVSRTYLPAVAAAFIVAEAAAGLDYAHRRKDEQGKPLGIIHRDVSPQNILISVDGAVKVTDFGIVRAADNRHRTMDGMSVGKLGYMSPEQVAGEAFDARADVFALGVMLWELLTLQPLLPRQDANAALQILLKGEFRRPSQINTGLLPSIDQLVMPAIARQPDRRTPSAGAFAQSLRGFIHSVSPGFDSGEFMRIIGRLLPNLAVHAANPVEVPATAELTNPGASPWGGGNSPHGPQAMVAIPAAAVAGGRLPKDPDDATMARKGTPAGGPSSVLDDDAPTGIAGNDAALIAAARAAHAKPAAQATLVAQNPMRPPQGPTVALNASITAGGIPNQRPSPAPAPPAMQGPMGSPAPKNVSLSRSGVNIPATTALAAFPMPPAANPGYVQAPQNAPTYPPAHSSSPAPGAMPMNAAPRANMGAAGPMRAQPQPGMHAGPAMGATYPNHPFPQPGYSPSMPPGMIAGGSQNQNNLVLPLVALGLAVFVGAGAVITYAVFARHKPTEAITAPVTMPAPTPIAPSLPTAPPSGYGNVPPGWNPGAPQFGPAGGTVAPTPTIPGPPGSEPPGGVFAGGPSTGQGVAPGSTGGDAGTVSPPGAPTGAPSNTAVPGPSAGSNGGSDPGGSPARHSSPGAPADVLRRQLANARAQVANCVGGAQGTVVDADVTYDGDHRAVSHVSAQITGSTGRPFASLCVKHALQNALDAGGLTGSVTVHYRYQF